MPAMFKVPSGIPRQTSQNEQGKLQKNTTQRSSQSEKASFASSTQKKVVCFPLNSHVFWIVILQPSLINLRQSSIPFQSFTDMRVLWEESEITSSFQDLTVQLNPQQPDLKRASDFPAGRTVKEVVFFFEIGYRFWPSGLQFDK